MSSTFNGGDPTTSWTWKVGIHPTQRPDPGKAYAVGLFSSVLMLFGADTYPETLVEIVCAIVIMIIGAGIHATLFGQVSHRGRSYVKALTG
jgi:hypothetical protein